MTAPADPRHGLTPEEALTAIHGDALAWAGHRIEAGELAARVIEALERADLPLIAAVDYPANDDAPSGER